MKPITDMTERELIAAILRIYTGKGNEKAVLDIAHHIDWKLRHRRTLLRERRNSAGQRREES